MTTARKTNGSVMGRGHDNGATAKTSPHSQDGQRWATRLEKVEKEISKAENTVTLRDKDLEALKSELDKLDTECREKYGCPLTELEKKLTAEELALADQIGQLERDLQHERDTDNGQPSSAATAQGAT